MRNIRISCKNYKGRDLVKENLSHPSEKTLYQSHSLSKEK